MTSYKIAKQVHFFRLFLWALLVSSLSASAQVTVQDGDYNYRNGAYRGITDDIINRSVAAVDYAGDTAQAAGDFLNKTMNFGAWRSDNDAYAALSGGVHSQFYRPGSINGSSVSLLAAGGIAPDPWLNLKLGPLNLDRVYGGAGFMYSDYTGDFINGRPIDARAASDDGFASVLWAQARLTAYVTDRFAISLTPSVYYLPFKNQVGWGLGNLFSNINANTAPGAILETGYRFPLLGQFQVSFYDQFRAMHTAVSLFRNSPFYWTSVADQTPVDFAGRYQFGGFGGFDRPGSRGSSKFALRDKIFDGNSIFFMNQASVNMRGRHSDDLVSNVYYNRLDYFDHSMNRTVGWNTIGGVLIQQGPVLSPYVRAEVTSSDNSGQQFHYEYALVGVNAKINPNLLAYAESGWMTSTVANHGSTESWLGRFGIRQRLGPYTSHGLDISRNPSENFANHYLINTAQYYIAQQLGAKASARAYVQQSELNSISGLSAFDRDVTTVGLIAEARLSPRSTLSLASSYENVDVPAGNLNYEMWTYRLMYNRILGQSLTGNIYYQYQETGSGASAYKAFSENLLFVGVVKRF